MNFRERVEQNPLFFLLTALFAGFVAGLGTYKGILEIAQLEVVPKHKINSRDASPATAGDPEIPTDGRDESPLSPASIRMIPNVTTQTVGEVVAGLRREFRVRPLAASEDGKRLRHAPTGTYAFGYASMISTYPGDDRAPAERITLDRSGSKTSYFEILNPVGGPATLVAFCGASEAASIAVLDGRTSRSITLSPTPWSDANTLVLIPIERLATASRRLIQLDDGRRLDLIDADLR